MVLTLTELTTIRPVEKCDASRIQEIYRPYIMETPFNLDMEVPSVEMLELRIEQVTKKYPFIVAEYDGQVIGFTYVNDFYQYGFEDACLLSIYVANDAEPRGTGSLLFQHLEGLLIAQGIQYIVASIVGSNVPSLRFHAKQSFTEVVRLPNIAYKHQQFHDLIWMAKRLDSMVSVTLIPALIAQTV